MTNWFWVGVLVAAVWAAHWGAERMAKPLKKLRVQWGLTEVAGAAFVGLAAAGPEIGINTASVIRGVGDIGLGTNLGSNILAIPLITAVAYLSTRKRKLGGEESGPSDEHKAHRKHIREHLLASPPEAVTVQTLPYLGILVVFALLTVPEPWRGLQPLDGWILLAVYGVYLAQALRRDRKQREDVEWTKGEIGMAAAGVLALATGAFFTVRATENIVSALGISRMVGGLFITAPMAALPEAFAVWSVARSGQVTAATTSVFGDHAVTMTLAFLPLAFVTTPIKEFVLFAVNLGFVALVPAIYAALNHWGSREHGFKLWQVLALAGVYLAYIAVVVLSGLLKS